MVKQMEKKSKIIIAVVALIIVIIVAAAIFFAFTMETVLYGEEAKVTLPGEFTIDENNPQLATAGDVSILFMPKPTSSSSEMKYLGAVKSSGKEAGYKNITNTTINGYKAYEFAGDPDKLENVSTDKVVSGNYLTWTTFAPYLPTYDLEYCDHFRCVDYVKGSHVNSLYIYTDSPSVSLYTPEIDEIIHSIADAEEQ